MPRAKPRSDPTQAEFTSADIAKEEGEQLLRLLGESPGSRGWWDSDALRATTQWIGLLNAARKRDSMVHRVLARPPARVDFVSFPTAARKARGLHAALERLSARERHALAVGGVDVTSLSTALIALVAAAEEVARGLKRLPAGKGRQPNLALQEAIRGLRALYRKSPAALDSASRKTGELDFVLCTLKIGSSTWMAGAAISESDRRAALRKLFKDPRFTPAPAFQTRNALIDAMAARRRDQGVDQRASVQSNKKTRRKSAK